MLNQHWSHNNTTSKMYALDFYSIQNLLPLHYYQERVALGTTMPERGHVNKKLDYSLPATYGFQSTKNTSSNLYLAAR